MKRFLIFIGILLLVMMLFVPVAFAEGVNGTTISATVSATPHWTKTFDWTIDKSVAPDTWNLFKGDSGTSQYTIAVTKDTGTDAAWIDGQVTVTNGGAVNTESLAIGLELSVPPSKEQVATGTVDVSNHPVLTPGETFAYNYSIMAPQAGGTYKVTANVTITNHSNYLGSPYGPSPSWSGTWPTVETLVHDSITVSDSNNPVGSPWTFNTSGSVSYDETFSVAGTYHNTATIEETGQSASASVTVNRYALDVTKTANTSFTRTYAWTIGKSADQSSLTLALNQVFGPVNYLVTVPAPTPTDSDWAVSGTITVHNPAPIPATINGISDLVSPDIAATVDFGSVTFPYTLAAGGTLTGTYSTNLPNATSRTNTATATLQNYAYSYTGDPTDLGTTDFTGTAAVDFTSAMMTEIDKSITVSDTYAGLLGTVTYGVDTLPTTFTYSRNIGPYTASGNYTVDNTASFVTSDKGTTGSASWTVNVNVPSCGATLTIGYWKTHAGFGPQKNMVSPLLPILMGTSGGAKTQTVTIAAQAVQFLSFKGSNNVFNASNGINKLYAQLLAAKLNIANKADGSAVASTITAADAFLATHDSTSWSTLTKTQQNQVLGWATTLENYNSGIIGPGHASGGNG